MGHGEGASIASARTSAPFIGAAAVAWLAALVGTSVTWPKYALSLVLALLAGAIAVHALRREHGWGIVLASLTFLVAAAFLRDSAGGMSSGVGAISLVAVFFTALYTRSRRHLFVVVSGVALFYLAPILIVGAPEYPDSQYRAALLSVAISAIIGITTQRLVAAFHRKAEEAEKRGEMLERLGTVVHALFESPEARRDVCVAARDVCEATVALLYEPATERDELWCSATAGFDGEDAVGTVAGDESIVYDAFGSGEPQLITEDVESKVGSLELWRASGCPSSILYQPLTYRGARIGILVIGWPGAVVMDGHRATAAGLLAHEAAGVIARADALEHLTDEAQTDALTGLPNRRAWDVHLGRTLMDDGHHVACVLDLDHFKQFNDTHGHPAGDRLLKETASAWRDQLRSGDFLARIGGEEFGLLLLNCSTGTALDVVERLRDAVAGDRTCSAGVAVRRLSDTQDSLVARADEALYTAKSEGRDQTCLSPDDQGRGREYEPVG
jgi:diguanylate cyclase (GGDEF)-like protein